MLFFCEDCGEKNLLEPNRSNKEIFRFRCRRCKYLNVVSLRKIPQPDSPPFGHATDDNIND